MTRALLALFVFGAHGQAFARTALSNVVVVKEITATSAATDAWRVLDHDHTTGWCAGQPAAKGEGVTITLDTPTLVDEVVVRPASPTKAGIGTASFTSTIEVTADGRSVTLSTKPDSMADDLSAKLGKQKVKTITVRFSSASAGPVCLSEVVLQRSAQFYVPVWDLPKPRLLAAPDAVMATWGAFASCNAKAIAARVSFPIEFTETAKAGAAPVVTRYDTAGELAKACRTKHGPKPLEPGEGNYILDTVRYRYPGELVFLATLTIDVSMRWRFGWRKAGWQLIAIDRRPTR